MIQDKIAVVTGGSRGIGKEISRQLAGAGYQVILTGRDLSSAKRAAEEVGAVPFSLDVCDEGSVVLFANFMAATYSHLDVLVNNAGVIGNEPMRNFDMQQIQEVMDTNLYGPMRMTHHLMPLLKKSQEGRIINLSSGMGALDAMKGGGYGAYRLSKASLNAFTLILSGELADVKVFSLDPGWVKTDMGGSHAPRSVEKGAETATWLATSGDAQTGKFYRDKKIIPW